MAAPPQRWRLYAGGGLLIWALGLQLHLWRMQRTPEYQEKFGGRGDKAEPSPKTQHNDAAGHRNAVRVGHPDAAGDYYAVLGVAPNASTEELRAAYRSAILRLHPDKATGGGGAAAAARPAAAGFQDVQRAWEVLRDGGGRAAYDRRAALQALQSELAVAEQVDLDDMEWRPGAASELRLPGVAPGAPCPASGAHPRPDAPLNAGGYARRCRCGGEFWLPEGELREDAESVLVPCSTCSACIRVLYGLAS